MQQSAYDDGTTRPDTTCPLTPRYTSDIFFKHNVFIITSPFLSLSLSLSHEYEIDTIIKHATAIHDGGGGGETEAGTYGSQDRLVGLSLSSLSRPKGNGCLLPTRQLSGWVGGESNFKYGGTVLVVQLLHASGESTSNRSK